MLSPNVPTRCEPNASVVAENCTDPMLANAAAVGVHARRATTVPIPASATLTETVVLVLVKVASEPTLARCQVESGRATVCASGWAMPFTTCNVMFVLVCRSRLTSSVLEPATMTENETGSLAPSDTTPASTAGCTSEPGTDTETVVF